MNGEAEDGRKKAGKLKIFVQIAEKNKLTHQGAYNIIFHSGDI